MKYLSLLIVFCFLLAPAVSSGSDPVAYWNFDSNFNATIGGSAYDATGYNGVAINPTVGKFGGAASFTKSSKQYLQTTLSPFTSGSYTYSAWYYLNVDDGAISTTQTDANRYFVLEATNGSTYPASYGLRDLGSGDVGQVYTQTTTASNFSFPESDHKTWQNVIVTYDSATGITTGYLNGSYVGQMTNTSTLAASSKLVIGSYRSCNERFWNGYIDELAVWNRVLSTSEITGLQNQTVSALPVIPPTPPSPPPAPLPPPPVNQWVKGDLHSHSLWSDGNELPELTAAWYKDNGYAFLTGTDHNTAQTGSVYKTPSLATSCDAAESRFGPGWVVKDATGKVKLKTFTEISAKLAEKDKFLMIPSEEITDGSVHINAFNVASYIPPSGSATAAEKITANFNSIEAQAKATNRPILAQVNHPNYQYAVTPEELAHADTRFFEVMNGSITTMYGDATHPGQEKMWDIANTIRIGTMKTLPIYGTATDDAHNYNPSTYSSTSYIPGRGWVMVGARELTTESIFAAMENGDFYSSTGVTLSENSYDPSTRVLTVAVQPENGVTYTIDFIGTREGVDPTKGTNGYSEEIGKVLKSVTATTASYTFTGDELYVRAHIRSNRSMSIPLNGNVQWAEAWTQPVGSWITVPEPTAGSMLLCIGTMLSALALAKIGLKKRR